MTCDTLGLYARSVEDLELLTSVFQLADDEPISREPFKLKGAKIAFCKTHVWPTAGVGTISAFETGQAILEKHAAIDAGRFVVRVLAGEGRTSFLGSEYVSPFDLPVSNVWFRLPSRKR